MKTRYQTERDERVKAYAAAHLLCDVAGLDAYTPDGEPGAGRAVGDALLRGIGCGFVTIGDVQHLAEHADEDPTHAANELRRLADALDAIGADASALAAAVDTWLGEDGAV